MNWYSPCSKLISDEEIISSLTFITLRANSTDNNLMILFSKTGFDISFKLSPEMSNPVSGTNQKNNFKMSSLDFVL